MLSSEIINRALLLADAKNNKAITYDDKVESLFESYKDVYTELTNSSDDYFVNEVILSGLDAVNISLNEWLWYLPADCYKIRFVNYFANGRWKNMEKFPTAERNTASTFPKYRWKNQQLWVVGSDANGIPSQIKVDYYPPPFKPTIPEDTLYYGANSKIYDWYKFSSPSFYMDGTKDYMFYIYDNLQIKVESLANMKDVTLYTSVTPLSNLLFYKGYIYFIKGGDIYRSVTDFATTITAPTKLTTSTTITHFSLAKDKIFYYDGAITYQSNLDGTGVSGFLSQSLSSVDYINDKIVYIKDADKHIWIDNVDTTQLADSLTTDGTILYYLKDAVLRKANSDFTTIERFSGEVKSLGIINEDYVPIIDEFNKMYAVSSIADTNIGYPSNLATEIMSYQCAIDFRRKADGDTSQLEKRLAAIWDRFYDQAKRDEYSVEHRYSEFNNSFSSIFTF